MAEHVEVDELEDRGSFDVWELLAIGSAELRWGCTEILRFCFGPAFFEGVEDVGSLVAFVGAESPDEVVERLFEPAEVVNGGAAESLGTADMVRVVRSGRRCEVRGR